MIGSVIQKPEEGAELQLNHSPLTSPPKHETTACPTHCLPQQEREPKCRVQCWRCCTSLSRSRRPTWSEFPCLHPEFRLTNDDSIVFVHGMNPANVPNHAYRTWTHVDGTLWPRDLLPKASSFSASRVMLFSYNSNIALGSTNATIFDHASSLFSLLAERRAATKSTARHLLFVAHSLGGLVVKQVCTSPGT